MKSKIIGIVICILFVITIIPSTDGLKSNVINPIIPNFSLPFLPMNMLKKSKQFFSDISGIIYFEYCASVDGDTAVVGAYRSDTPYGWGGSVYVFTRMHNIWKQQQRIYAPTAEDEDTFGWSVAVSGDTILIGVPYTYSESTNGSVYVFTRIGTRWIQQAKLFASDDSEKWNWFGASVALDGDTALIGACSDNENGNWSGSAYVFTRTDTAWTQQAKLLASDGVNSDLFGASVSLDGDTALIGAPGDGYQRGPGSAYVFTRSSNIWTQQAKLFDLGADKRDQFGISVSINGNTALIGARQYENYRNGPGVAYVFTRNETIWSRQAKLIEPDGERYDNFGYSVAVSGDTAIIGAYGHWNGDYSGSVYVFTREVTLWVLQQTLVPLGQYGWNFGISVALDGDTALITAYFDGDTHREGASYIFICKENTWVEQTRLFNSAARSLEYNQLFDDMMSRVSMKEPYYSIIEHRFQRLPNAFPLVRQLMGY